MRTLDPFIHTTIDSCPPGSFFRAWLGGVLTLGIRLKSEENGRVFYCVLEGRDGRKPFFLSNAVGSVLKCAVYPDTCVIQPILTAESVPGNRASRKSGTVCLFDGGAAIVLSMYGSHADFDDKEFNLETGVDMDIPRDAVPVVEWKIWESADAIHQFGSEPLFHFSMPPEA